LLPYGDFDIFVREGLMLVSSPHGLVETHPYVRESSGQEKLSGLKREEGCYTQFFHDLILSNRLYPKGRKAMR
jgi:hypothetical protein